jgi:hypothetical protein
MTINYDKVWEVMNDLEQASLKLLYIKELLDVIYDASAEKDNDRVEKMALLASDYLGNYIEEYDRMFSRAWNNTVLELKDERIETIRENNYGFGQSLDKDSVQEEFNSLNT